MTTFKIGCVDETLICDFHSWGFDYFDAQTGRVVECTDQGQLWHILLYTSDQIHGWRLKVYKMNSKLLKKIKQAGFMHM
jgi:nitrite reductase/ring-hydroxylating ferredoxin subunit